VLQKGRFLLTLTLLTCAALILSASALSLAQEANPFAAKPYAQGMLTPSGRNYIGLERPDWLFERMAEMRTAQGSGPVPDLNLTPTATTSTEYHANSAPYGELNRIVISSNGVDADRDGRFDPGATADDLNLWMLRVDGSFATQLTSAPGDEAYPAYDAGGRLVAFSSNATGVWQIYTVEVLTGTIRQLTFSPGNKYEPTWSPDSTQIVFSGDAGGNRDLYIIPADGSQLPTAITQTPENETQPKWAPVGGGANPIMFTRSTAGAGSRIWRIGPGGGNQQQVTNGGGDAIANDTDPAWRHNGQMIAFASDRLTDALDTTRDYNIFTVAPAGENGAEALLRSNLDPANPRDDRYPAFNPGLSPRQPVRIFFSSWRDGNQPDIWRLEVRDPVPPELVRLPWVDAPRRFTPPGSDMTIHAEVFDRDSGVAAVVAEMKDPDSAVDDSQGIDHKQFIPIGGVALQSGLTDATVYREVDCDTVGQVALLDNGDPANGDEIAGDGIFSGIWTTPTSPSDFIVDIHVQDNAGNSFEYDDIFGFTTQQFQPQTNVLLVNDYCEGQGFIFAASGANNDHPTQFPVESYYTTNPGAGGSPNTIRDAPKGTGEPYDIWRVICRGQITITDLIYYLPTVESQLAVPDATGTRQVLVADRAVVWAAPHTGTTWVGDGSLVSATTQATLSTFLDRGGRLMISGQDIGFALTLDGTSNNNFYSNYLHASFVRADHNGVANGGITDDLISGTSGDPVVAHPFPFWPPLDVEIPDGSAAIGWWVTNNILYPQDCAHYSVWPDVIEAGPSAVVTHSYAGGATAGVRYAHPGGGYRVAYYAWGFEQTHQVWGGSPVHVLNYRSKFMHNTLCWLRTGGFQGRVLSISDGNQPINDPTPIVRVFSGSTMVAAVQVEEDGRYVVGGLPPGSYSLTASRPGFDIDHSTAEPTHGGLTYPVVDFAIARAEPGAIRGTVTSLATGEPLATVKVCAYAAIYPSDDEEEQAQTAQSPDYELGQLIGCTTTAADGTYQIGNVPPGEVVVVADGTAIGYGTAEVLANVTSGNTTQVDVALEAAPGNIHATVTDTEDAPLANASVQALSGTTVVASGITDANGEVTLQVQPGAYSVEATRAGYQRSAPAVADVSAAQTVTVELVLEAEPPGTLSGLISRGLTGEPVGGMTVELIVNDVVIDTAVTTATTDTAPNGSRYNFRFADVPTGQITVRPDPTGFTVTPTERIVTVTTAQESTGVNFSVRSIRTFPAGLQLVSLPWDYPNADPAELLGADPATLKMATWEPETGQYALYPSTPADHFRLGSGYWLRLSEPRELTREGIPAGDVFYLPLEAGASGWNLIGDFFTEPIDFFSLHVRDRTGVVRTMQQAMAAGLVRSPLYAYVFGGYATSAVIEPYVGYWLNVGDDIVLIGNRNTDTLAERQAASAPAIAAPEGGWLMPLVVTSGAMTDASTWLGCAPAATAGFDPGLDLLKPPPVDMGRMVYAAADGPTGAQGVDLRPAGGATWTLSVQGPVGEKVVVRWPDLSDVPADLRPVLVDDAAGRTVYMRTSQSYEFTAREDTRQLQIRLSDAGAALAVTTPAARATGAGVEISYTLSADARVDVRVLNIAGRAVGTILSDETQAAGVQRLTWDGISASGTRAPAGTYLIVIAARAGNGQQTQAIGTVSVGR